MKRIFIQMVSYRDPECHHTLADMFAKATHPERVSVGLCWQYDPLEDAEMIAVPLPRPQQVRVVQFHVRDAQGAGWARNEAQKLWAGEEYILQLQAHHRFEQGWDETLIALLEALPTRKAILTAWLPTYTPPDEKADLQGMLPVATINRLGDENDAQIVHLIKKMQPQEQFTAPFLTGLWVGNFMFTRAETLRNVPFDPHIYFWGEELNYSARLWTHGYDIYHLDRVVLHHYWDRKGVKHDAEYRNHQAINNQQSLARNLHVLGVEPAEDEDVLDDIEKYALGKMRPISDYFAFIGVDLTRGTIAPHARNGIFKVHQEASGKRPKIFVAIASFRDPETQATLADIFVQALYPDRIHVGICHQLHPTEDADCLFAPTRPKQVKLQQVDYRESKGANWARAQAIALHDGEEYILQIDAHMRFEHGWDEILVDMLARCPSKQAVISAYLPRYDLPDVKEYSPDHILRMCIRRLGEEGDPQLVHLTGQYIHKSKAQVQLYRTPFVIANFMFARAEIWKKLPIDPHIYFYGDEISLSARLWTHGVDIYQPDCGVAFHRWLRPDQQKKQDYRKIRNTESERSRQRVRNLLELARAHDTTAINELEQYGLGNIRPLADFWEFAGVDLVAGTVSKAAEKGLWQEMESVTKEQAKNSLPRIFVQIASYRDPECQHTVKNLFDKATHPERIFVGICWQVVKEEDAICFTVPYPYPDQVRVHEVDARKGRGVCWARSLTQALWQGEEFTLQIDSHMRFEQGWDETLLSMLKKCKDDNAVLTCYPPGYTPPDKLESKFFFGLSAKEFDYDGIFKMIGSPPYTASTAPALPMVGAFASANMLFGPASIIRDVPYDPHLYFFGEEISLAARLWTHGYNLYQPNAIVVYHDWNRGNRPTHFSDNNKTWQHQNKGSVARVRHLFGTEQTNDASVLVDIEKYGFGTVRSLAQYQEYCGVDFSKKIISEKAKKGEFVMKDKLEIFVRIASYRDSECQWTVKDLFEKATYPDRIHVGICWQFDENEDAHCFEVTTRPEQVRVYPVNRHDSDGVCWARAQTEMLMEEEPYTLQIDSHMRFAPGWDEALIAELDLCPSEKAVLSCGPAQYTPPNNLEPIPKMTIRTLKPFSAIGNVRCRSEFIDVAPEAPLLGAFVAGGFIFSRSDLVRDVPYDPYLYFDQEEIMLAMRLYTHGWDVYVPRKQVLYHFYNIGEGSGRPLHWDDMQSAADKEKLNFLSARGLARFNHLSGYKISNDSRTLVEIDKYGLGDVRSLADFETFVGIDFKNKIVQPKAEYGGFIPHLERYRSQPIALASAMDLTESSRAPFEVGDMLPYFIVNDTNGNVRPIELAAGSPALLFFLPYAEPKGNQAFFRALNEAFKAADKPNCQQFFILDATVEQLATLKEKYKLPHILWADPEQKIARALGLSTIPSAFLLGANLQIKKQYISMPPTEIAVNAVADAVALLKKPSAVTKSSKPIAEVAPVLIVPEVFSPELCGELIAAFRKGKTFAGEVGSEGYVSTSKVREDFIVPEELRKKIDLKLSRSLFPEIEKVFGFKVTGRENYKIGLYDGKKEGFFAQHRDNFDEALGYRRVAMTLHLSDDYEGGGLRFPEYDNRVYRPTQGGAVAFSCGVAHEACKVTKGERFILVGFFHGEEEENYRQHYTRTHNQPLQVEEFKPLQQPVEGIAQSRDFYRRWKEQHKQQEIIAPAPALVVTPPALVSTPVFAVGTARHQPVKIFESRGGIAFDNFLPEKLYEEVQNYCYTTDYEHINTKGKVARAWHVHDGFPLRSMMNAFYYPDKGTQPMPKPAYVHPTGTGALDRFIDFMAEFQPQVERYVGKGGSDGWNHFSVTSWLYPPGTGLAMHDDGSGVYTGAYAFFLNKTWRAHWGGMLLIMDDVANDMLHAHRRTVDQGEYHKQKWLHANNTDELMLEHGMARCIFPKGNRMVFIANDAYHMVTRVNETAGDNLRVSLAGFFDRTKK